MKTAGIIRIVTGSLVAAFLIYILAAALTGNPVINEKAMFPAMVFNIPTNSDAKNTVISNQGEIPVSEVKEVQINWTSGIVHMQVGTGESILFEEASSVNLTESQSMRYSLSDGKLRIDYCTPSLNTFALPSKALTVTLPQSANLTSLSIDTSSADIDAQSLYAQEIELETVSGRIDGTALKTQELDVCSTSGRITLDALDVEELESESTSGVLYIQGAATRIEAESVSGDMVFNLARIPSQLKAEAISGKISLGVPQDENGFIATVSTTSGSFRCDSPVLQNGNRYTVGKGVGAIHLKTVSGAIEIQES